MENKSLQTYVDDAFFKEVKEIAKEKKLSLAATVRTLLAEYINLLKNKKK